MNLKNTEGRLKDYQDTLEEKVRIRTDELAKSNSELANFAYIASHDLREPLRMITSFLQLLERRYMINWIKMQMNLLDSLLKELKD